MRAYLLGQLSETDEERIELRLLSDDDYFTKMEMVENELVDEYAHGALSAEEREQAEKRFLRAPERQQKLAFAVALSEEIVAARAARVAPKLLPFNPRRFFNPAHLKMAAAVGVIAVGVGLAVWWLSAGRSDVSRAMAALNAAHKAQRLTEARISELGYAPIKELRGGQPATDYAARNLAERLLLDAISEDPDAAAHHALGRLYLSEGKLDEAQDQFEKAQAAGGGGRRLDNDFGALWLERGKAQQPADAGRAAEYFGRSLEHLERALKADDSFPEALFNRALVYQHLRLPQQAQAAWRAYIEKDSASPWADEARRSLKALEEQERMSSQHGEQFHESFTRAYRASDADAAWAALTRSRSRAGNLIIESLLDEWLHDLEVGNEAEAAERLRMLSFAGELEAARAGDRYTSDLTTIYSRADTARRQTLAHARRLKRRATERYNDSEFEAAIALFAEAAGLFYRAGDACEALLAESWIGYCELRIPRAEQSRRRFERLTAIFEERGYKSLLAQSLHAQGDARTSEDDLSQALDLAGRALKVSEQIQDDVTRLRCLQLFVSMHLKFGNFVESLKYAHDAMGLAQTLPFDPKLVWTFYHEAALDFYWLDLPAAALELETEALRLAEASGWPLIISRSHSRLGVIHEARRDYDAAIRSGLRSIEAGEAVEGEQSRLSILSHASLRLGHLYRQAGDFSRALARYDESLRMFERLNLGIYLYEVRKGRFLALTASGDDETARQELTEALRLLEQYREKILEERHRNSFFDAGQDTYDLATDFAYAKMGNVEQAFEYTETSRARSLLNLMHTSAQVADGAGMPDITNPLVTRALSLSEIQAGLPERSQVLQYAVLGDKLITWVITREGVMTRAQNISADELRRKVTAYLRQLTGDDRGHAENSARELYSLLISPVEQWLNEGSQVCIVPDKSLVHLPYAALVSPESGRFLIERYTLVLSPSASVFIACTKEARARSHLRGGGLLSVGNPHFSRRRFPRLPDLPAAAREAEQVARLYNGAALLVGAAAREERVRQAMRSAEVIHLASHYVADERSPLLSRLLLADTGTEPSPPRDADGVLQAFEIYGMKLPRARLVVLSACQTGVEQALRGEGAIGMARSFLSAGAPLVVASLWPVESDATAELMIKFHGYRWRGGHTSAQALRQAQQDMIRDPDPLKSRPQAWAAFIPYGGYEEL